jgi:hypothetical protein
MPIGIRSLLVIGFIFIGGCKEQGPKENGPKEQGPKEQGPEGANPSQPGYSPILAVGFRENLVERMFGRAEKVTTGPDGVTYSYSARPKIIIRTYVGGIAGFLGADGDEKNHPDPPSAAHGLAIGDSEERMDGILGTASYLTFTSSGTVHFYEPQPKRTFTCWEGKITRILEEGKQVARIGQVWPRHETAVWGTTRPD